jgi:hypothetical protein
METAILLCTCSHEYQDVTYGANKRVFNWAPGQKNANSRHYRCTVCKATKLGPEIKRGHKG